MADNPRLQTLISSASNEETDTHDAPVDRLSGSVSVGALAADDLVAGRFRIRWLAETGGMGDVYRASDLTSGRDVALKVCRVGRCNEERFSLEAQCLERVQHIGIPSYVSHGRTEHGQSYLAMEWVEGVSLFQYLQTHRLGLKSCANLLLSVAEAIAAAHEEGIVHRDLNPRNLLLVRGEPEDVRVVDFGVAQTEAGTPPLTEMGTQIGTPGYMAPEQIEARQRVTKSADVFALGSIFFEILTGERAFYAPTVAGVFARIVRDDPPRLREFSSAIPEQLDRLLAEMLSKEPDARPADAGQLVERLRGLPPLDENAISHSLPSLPRVTDEQRICSVVLLKEDREGAFERTQLAAEAHGLTATRGPDRTIVIVTSGSGAATDHAMLAVRCAAAVQQATRARHVSVSTGLNRVGGAAPSGRAYDQALVSLLLCNDEQPGEESGSTIGLDENTAALLDARFEVGRNARGCFLSRILPIHEPARPGSGRKTRCVGRHRELVLLETTLRACMEEHCAQAVLLTGSPGIGKSRLAFELGRLVRRSGWEVEILRGSGDCLTAGAPFAPLVQALRGVCTADDREPEMTRRARLHARLEKGLSSEERRRLGDQLGELLAADPLDAVSGKAEDTPRDDLHEAFLSWLSAEAAQRPTIVLLEDFHWGDEATVRLVDAALRHSSELPLFFLVLARPEVHKTFPNLWAQRGVMEIRLAGLSSRACREMTHEVLGEVSQDVENRLVDRAQGNPLWLQELLRAEVEGQGEESPERVLLLAQSHLAGLDEDVRRVLRTASVFGRQFWSGAARYVVGPRCVGRPLHGVLQEAVEASLLIDRGPSTLMNEDEFEFASTLLRDAAYSLLSEEEKEAAHTRAAEWLEGIGGYEALPIAMHYTLGGESDRARPYYIRAAKQALADNDLDAAVSSVEEGLATGAVGAEGVELRLVQAEANRWRGDLTAALRSARAAFSKAPPGTANWFRAAAEAAVASGRAGKLQDRQVLQTRLVEQEAQRAAGTSRAIALCRMAAELAHSGELDAARQTLDLVSNQGSMPPDSPRMGQYNRALAALAACREDYAEACRLSEEAIEHFEDAGELRNGCETRVELGHYQLHFGRLDAVRNSLEVALETAQRLQLHGISAAARACLGRVHCRLGDPESGLVLLQEAAGRLDTQRYRRLAGLCRVDLAEAHLQVGAAESAEESAAHATTLLAPLNELQRVARAMLSLTLLEQGRLEEARESAEQANAGLARDEHPPLQSSLVRLSLIESLRVSGHMRASKMLLVEQMLRIEKYAAEMSPAKKRAYEAACPARARLFALCGDEFESTVPFRLFSAERGASQENQHTGQPDDQTTVAGSAEPSPERTSESTLLALDAARSCLDLSTSLASIIGLDVAWSGAAGSSAEFPRDKRVEELFARLVSEENLVGVSRWTAVVLEHTGLADRLRAALLAGVSEAQKELLRARRDLIDARAPIIRDFVALLHEGQAEVVIEQFITSLGSRGEAQCHFQAALRAFHSARTAQDGELRRSYALTGNCELTAFEQLRLQPIIDSLSSRFVPDFVLPRVQQRKRLSSWLCIRLGDGFLRRAEGVWREVLPRQVMNMSLPTAARIPLVPAAPLVVRPPLLGPPSHGSPSTRDTEPDALAFLPSEPKWQDVDVRIDWACSFLRKQEDNAEA